MVYSYEITGLLLRTLRFPEIRTCETIDELRRVIVKADSHIACRPRAISLPCRAAKGLECVFPI